MLYLLKEVLLSIRWLYVLICTLILTTLHLGYRSQEFLDYFPTSKLRTGGRSEEYLALCLVVKDEQYYLKEWLQHHYYHMNVTHFYITDQGTIPPLSETHDLGIPRSAITFRYAPPDMEAWPKYHGIQIQRDEYQRCWEEYGHKHRWMGFIDLDEFIDVKTTETLEGILRDAETHDEFGALKLQWKIHTSAGLLEHPKSMRKSFDMCMGPGQPSDIVSCHVKSIVRTNRFLDASGGPHQYVLQPGNISFGEDFEDATLPWDQRHPITYNRVFLHHYLTKSKAEYQEKIDRWEGNTRTWEDWDLWHAVEVECPEMKRYDP